jgi:hypothetical protein
MQAKAHSKLGFYAWKKNEMNDLLGTCGYGRFRIRNKLVVGAIGFEPMASTV